MAGSVNKVIIIGNLGRDPELRTTASGMSVANMTVATSRTRNDREGNRQEETEWHRVVLWGKLAELAQKYLSKGRKVYIEGRLQTRDWVDQQSGQKRYSTEIWAEEMTFLDSGGGGGGGGGYQGGGGGGYQGGGGGGGYQGGGGGGGYQGGGGGYQGGGGGGYQGGGRPAGSPTQPAPASQPPAPAPPGPAGDDPGFFNDDDIPF